MNHLKVKNSLLILANIFLLGCSMNANFVDRDLEIIMKQEGEHIYCSGYKSWKDCYSLAKKVCQNGYGIINTDESLYSQKRVMRIICK
jgi:hypothetical protein